MIYDLLCLFCESLKACRYSIAIPLFISLIAFIFLLCNKNVLFDIILLLCQTITLIFLWEIFKLVTKYTIKSKPQKKYVTNKNRKFDYNFANDLSSTSSIKLREYIRVIIRLDIFEISGYIGNIWISDVKNVETVNIDWSVNGPSVGNSLIIK